ncbi:hypothetical protein MKW92_035415 [Papaver armeniacum]|nr:hypothetical protein MKW92_035415 [Papaver armeniacum]
MTAFCLQKFNKPEIVKHVLCCGTVGNCKHSQEANVGGGATGKEADERRVHKKASKFVFYGNQD